MRTFPKRHKLDNNQLDTSIPPYDLASCLALLTRISSDLAVVVENWNSIPKVVKTGIVAMVRASAP
jgi:hypothetical protein